MGFYLRNLVKIIVVGINSIFRGFIFLRSAINMPSTTATGAFGPAPPGVDLSQNQDGNLLGAVVPVAVCGTVAVGIRLMARSKSKDVKLAVDDYLILAALVRHALLCFFCTITDYHTTKLFSWGTAIACFISAAPLKYYLIVMLTENWQAFLLATDTIYNLYPRRSLSQSGKHDSLPLTTYGGELMRDSIDIVCVRDDLRNRGHMY